MPYRHDTDVGRSLRKCEAIHTLLKRREDDRKRLVVIMAGYPSEMDALLKSDPGLSSRVDRVLHFEDYSPLELAQIFGWLCDKNHYKLGPGCRAKITIGLTELHRVRDRHFGTGRAVPNLFEHAVRRMANRIAEAREISQEALMLLDAADIEFTGLSSDVSSEAEDAHWRFRVTCPQRSHKSNPPGWFLGQKVRCPKCQHEFVADWG